MAILVVWGWRQFRQHGLAAAPVAVEPSGAEATDVELAVQRRRRLITGLFVTAVLAVVFAKDDILPWFSSEGLCVTYYRGIQLHHWPRWGNVEKDLCRSFLEEPPVWWLGWSGFSTRWVGHLDAPKDDDYIFYCQSCDGMRLYLDDKCVLDNWRNQTWLESGRAVKLHLSKGLHPLKVEHYSRKCDDGAIRIRWSGGGIPPNTVLGAPYLRK